ncbi:hypothetical protein IFR05_000986 [Cadophora sp. M221]|nr:hypothetical protein IFR05_000986 [Cadophora sp. M221]
MESITAIVDPILPGLLSASTNTTPASMSESSTPKDSPKMESVNISGTRGDMQLEITKVETESKPEKKTEGVAPASAVNTLLARPTLPHANTDTIFAIAKEAQRVERRWRGMYDRNRVANPGATHGL